VYRIGLTGGIGSGKSTAAGILRELGARVIVADDLARTLVAAGTPLLERIADEFGSEVVAADGSLDRARLAAIAFSSEVGLGKLNELTHPPLVAAIVRAMEAAERETPAGVLVVDAALLLHWDVLDLFDVVVVVHAPREIRLERLEEAGRPRRDTEARMVSQAPEATFRDVADVVVDNGGSFEDLRENVLRFWRTIPSEVREVQ